VGVPRVDRRDREPAVGQRGAGSVGGRAEPRPGVARGEPPREEPPSVLGDERLAVVDDAVDGGLPDALFALLDQRLVAGEEVGLADGVLRLERVGAEQALAGDDHLDGEPGEADRVPGEPLGGDALDVLRVGVDTGLKGANVSVWTTSSRSSPTSATSIRPSKARGVTSPRSRRSRKAW